MNANPDIVKIFYCYAQENEEDTKLRDQLTVQLKPLREQRKLTIWLDVPVNAGRDWQLEIEKQLNEADLILLLMSPGFIASDYCYKLQLTAALNNYEAGKVEIVPILLRSVMWEETPIKRLPLILPTSKLPVTRWPDRDEAFANIARAIRDLVQAKLVSNRRVPASEIAALNQLGESVLLTPCPQCGTPNRIGARFCKNDGVDLLASQVSVVAKPVPPVHTREEWVKEGQLLFRQKLYADALAAYEQALLLDSHYATAYFYKGHALYTLQQYPAALVAYEQAERFSHNPAPACCHKGHTLRHLQRYTEALAAYERAFQLGTPKTCAAAWNGKGRIFSELKRYTEALTAYAEALRFNAQYAEPHVGTGNVLFELQRYTEACAAYEKASGLDPQYMASYFFKGNALFELKQYDKALAAYKKASELDPAYAPAWYGQGRVYEILGLVEEAKEAFAKAAALNSSAH